MNTDVLVVSDSLTGGPAYIPAGKKRTIDGNHRFTIKKPALKRTDVVDAAEGSDTTTETPDVTSTPGGRLRRTVGTVGVLAVGVVGLVTLRKLRTRRKNRQAVDSASE